MKGFMMLNKNLIDDLVKKILGNLPQNLGILKQDAEQHVRDTIANSLTKFNLVSREEFDIQAAVLQRTREKLEQLQKEVQMLQDKLT